MAKKTSSGFSSVNDILLNKKAKPILYHGKNPEYVVVNTKDGEKVMTKPKANEYYKNLK